MKRKVCQKPSQVTGEEKGHLWLILHSLTILFLIFGFSAHSAEKVEVQISRAPASTVVDTDIIEEQQKYPHWINRMAVEDNRGVMNGMKQQIQVWEEQDRYLERWNVSQYVMRAEDLENRRRFVKRQALRYLSRRLRGELKTASKSSGIYKVAQAQRTLSPSSQVKMGKNMRLKFRAKVLRGEIKVKFDNALFDSEAVLRASGRANVRVRRELKDLGIHTELDLDARAGTWSAVLNKQIDENWSTRLISNQDNADMAFSKNADSRFELFFNKPF